MNCSTDLLKTILLDIIAHTHSSLFLLLNYKEEIFNSPILSKPETICKAKELGFIDYLHENFDKDNLPNKEMEIFYLYRLISMRINITLDILRKYSFLGFFLSSSSWYEIKKTFPSLGAIDSLSLILKQLEESIVTNDIFQYIYTESSFIEWTSRIDIGDFDIYHDPLDLDKCNLPEIPSVYFVHSNYNLIYIGQTTNLKNRFVQHHRQPDFDYLQKMGIPLHINWISCEGKEELLLDEERYWITHLKPPLNNSSVIQLVA